MAVLKELRTRISSVAATKKIARAMQMVAAAKLRRAQSAVERVRVYDRALSEYLYALLGDQSSVLRDDLDANPLLVGRRAPKVHLLVVCTSERGLCGAFNASIVRLARKQIAMLEGEGKEVKLLTVGRKGHELLRGTHGKAIIEHINFREVRHLTPHEASKVASAILTPFTSGAVDEVSLLFSRFRSVLSQVPAFYPLIPLGLEEPDPDLEPLKPSEAIFESEPEEGELLDALLPHNLMIKIYAALLENATSEQGARMSAMDSATRNADEMIESLTLTYNKTRQAQITKELIEIISGAEALG